MRVVLYSLCLLLVIAAITPLSAQMQNKQPPAKKKNNREQFKAVKPIVRATDRANAAAAVMDEVMRLGRGSIPPYIFYNAEVIAVFSSRDTFSPIQDESGGVVCARDPKTRQWNAPIYLRFKGGHIEGLLEDIQLDSLFKSKEGDLILFGMSNRSTPFFLGEQFELGSDALVMSGSFGRVAKPGDEVPAVSNGFFAYFHSRGAIVGVSVSGSVITQDPELNDAVYEEKKLNSFLPVDKVLPEPIKVLPTTLAKYARS